MNFVDAINTHVAMKVHLQHLLHGTPDPTFDYPGAARDNVCELGRWLYDELTAWQDLPTYWTVLQDHGAFHRCIETILQLHAAGQITEAEQVLQQDYTAASHKLVHSLLELSHLLDNAAPES